MPFRSAWISHAAEKRIKASACSIYGATGDAGIQPEEECHHPDITITKELVSSVKLLTVQNGKTAQNTCCDGRVCVILKDE